ncbi:SitI3 family protein [Paenibacillus sp. RRE4]|uniref:SitI3 family protein n=1 Tax=Paenibacillus sp. RRE4 TaxID=2962587 RepID=UPI0037C86024
MIQFKKGIEIDETISRYGFSNSLIDTSDDPFGYESKFLFSDFEYTQSLNFRLDNEWDSIEATKNILLIVFEIIDSTDSNLLFSHNDNECFYRIDGILRINNEEGFWNREEYRTLIQNRNYQEM